MEIALVLLLAVTLTAAAPLRPGQRSEEDSQLPENPIQASEVKSTNDRQEQHVQTLRIVPFHTEDKHLDLVGLKHRMTLRLRPRRAAQGGCQLGTCQLHNLANTLYQISRTNGKEGSKNAHDPRGYGR